MTTTITLETNGHIRGRELSFLLNTDKMIRSILCVYGTLTDANPDFEQAYAEEGKPIGMSKGEYIPYFLDGKISAIDLTELQEIQLNGYFGEGPDGGKFLAAFTQLSDLLSSISTKAAEMEILSESDCHSLATQIRYAFGDFIFAFSRILYFPYTAYDIIHTGTDFNYSPVHINFFEKIKTTAFDYARYLFELSSRFVAIVPLYENDPERWIKLTQGMPPQLVSLLSEFGTYITEFDIRLLEMHYFEANDAFVEMLTDREYNRADTFIGCTDKNVWNDFTLLLSDNQIKKLAEDVNSITYNDIYVAVDRGKVTDKYIDDVIAFKSGSGAKPEEYLSLLASDLSVEEKNTVNETKFFDT